LHTNEPILIQIWHKWAAEKEHETISGVRKSKFKVTLGRR